MNNNLEKSVFGLEPNVAAGLAYVPVMLCHLIISIAVLASDKTNKLPRFHAVQSLLHTAVMFMGSIVFLIAIFATFAIVAVTQMPALMILVVLVYIVFLLFVLAWVIGLIIACIKGF